MYKWSRLDYFRYLVYEVMLVTVPMLILIFWYFNRVLQVCITVAFVLVV
jgi:hypothetical protein